MKKLTLLLFVSALALWAADFWQTKPFTSWDQKEAQKMITDSPWAHKLSVAMPSGGGPGAADPGPPAAEAWSRQLSHPVRGDLCAFR